MTKNRAPHGGRNTNDSLDHGKSNKRDVSGSINISGKVDAILPAKLVDEFARSSEKQDSREERRFWVEILTLIFLFATAIFALVQASQSIKAVKEARAANELTLETVRGRIVFSGPKFSYPMTVGKPISVSYTMQNAGHSVATYQIELGHRRWTTMPGNETSEDEILMSNLPPQSLAPDTPGGFGAAESEDLTQSYMDEIPTASQSAIDNPNVPTKPRTFFFGKLIYQSLGITEEVDFCAFIVRRDKSSQVTGNTIPDSGDPNFMFLGCPKWQGIKESSQKTSP